MFNRKLCFGWTIQPVVIGDGVLVSQIWPVVIAADDEKINTKNCTKVTCANYLWFYILILLNPAYWDINDRVVRTFYHDRSKIMLILDLLVYHMKC